MLVIAAAEGRRDVQDRHERFSRALSYLVGRSRRRPPVSLIATAAILTGQAPDRSVSQK